MWMLNGVSPRRVPFQLPVLLLVVLLFLGVLCLENDIYLSVSYFYCLLILFVVVDYYLFYVGIVISFSRK